MGKPWLLAVLPTLFLTWSDAVGTPMVWSPPQPVRIEGYTGDAMEPFLSRDGTVLFFNNRNEPADKTDIHFARRRDDLTFVYQDLVHGARSSNLDGVPTMARDGSFCFVSIRDYLQTLNSVFCGHFDGKDVVNVEPQMGLKTKQLGRLIFDVEISADGKQMVFAEGTFSGGAAPDVADLFLAARKGNGFERVDARLFDKVNSEAALEYAPGLSADGLELFFTRMTGWWIFRESHIYRAVRPSIAAPFGEPALVPIDGFVEAPTLSPDGRALYFHKRVDDRFSIWRMTRQ